jgi:hypothetical protein
MGRRILSLTLVSAGLILSCRSISATGLCVIPDFAGAAAEAEVIFSGKITNVERVQSSTAPAGEYIVTFKVETWWKGKSSPYIRVLWQSSVPECDFLPVGEVGEDYLVYGDARIRTDAGKFSAVSPFNRTSRLPANRKAENVVIGDWSKQARISQTPILNRADGTDDVKLLNALRVCGCLSTSSVTPLDFERPPSIKPNSRQAAGVSACQTCLRGRLKPF